MDGTGREEFQLPFFFSYCPMIDEYSVKGNQDRKQKTLKII